MENSRLEQTQLKMSKEPTLHLSPESFKRLTKTDALDRILSCLFFLAFLFVLLFFEIIQRTAHLLDIIKLPKFRKPSYQQWAAIGLNLSLTQTTRIVGAKLHQSFAQQLDPNKSYIFLANHQSFFDTFLLIAVLRQWNPKFVAKLELGKWIPSVSFNLRTGGHALIDRNNPRQAMPMLEAFATRAYSNGDSIILFPEGTRSRDGSLLPYRLGGFQKILTVMPNVAVVPVAIDGSWRTSAKRKAIMPRGIEISIDVGPEISTGQSHSAQEILTIAREFTEAKLTARRTPQTTNAAL